MSRPQPLALLAAAAVVLLLAACSAPAGQVDSAGDPQGGVSSSPVDPSAGPTVDPTTGPTDEPEGEEPEPEGPTTVGGPEPVSVLPLGCSQLASGSTIQAGFASTVTATITETSPPPNASRADFAQAGGLYCAWAGSGGAALHLGIVPDAAGNYAQRVSAQSGSGYRDDTLGDDSHVKCSVDGGKSTCTGDILVGDYWIAATLIDTRSGTSAAFDAYEGLLRPIADKVSRAGTPRGTWVSPTLDFGGAFLCANPRFPAAILIAGENGMTVKMTPRDEATQSGLMSSRVDSIACTWQLFGDAVTGFSTLPGGAWAFDRMEAAGVGVDVPTAFNGSRVVCTDRCTAYISFRGALVTGLLPVGIDDPDDTGSFLGELAREMGA